jgi:hypothetical protein
MVVNLKRDRRGVSIHPLTGPPEVSPPWVNPDRSRGRRQPGAERQAGQRGGLTLHWDGTRWAKRSAPTVQGDPDVELTGVSGISATS